MRVVDILNEIQSSPRMTFSLNIQDLSDFGTSPAMIRDFQQLYPKGMQYPWDVEYQKRFLSGGPLSTHLLRLGLKIKRISPVSMEGSKFYNKNFYQAPFQNMDLAETSFDKCHLNLTEFKFCILDKGQIHNTKMIKSNMRLSSLGSFKFTNTIAEKCSFIQSDLRDSIFLDNTFSDPIFSFCTLGANIWRGVTVKGGNFVQSTLAGMIDNCHFEGFKVHRSAWAQFCLSNSNFTEGRFLHSKMQGKFQSCDFVKCDFRDCDLREVRFDDCTFEQCTGLSALGNFSD